MTVAPTTSTTSTNPAPTKTTSTTPKASTVDYNSFLTLLIAQMKNQDPTSPSDPSAFMSQLASFSNVEQSVQMNGKLGSLLSLAQVTQADSVIGRVATSLDGKTSGVVTSVRIDSSGAVATLDSGATLNLSSGLTLS